MQRGNNMAIIAKNGNSIVAHAEQISPQGDYDEEKEEDLSVGIPSFDLVNKQENMAPQKETNDGHEL